MNFFSKPLNSLLLVAGLCLTFGLALHFFAIRVDENSTRFMDYRMGFMNLIEKELSANKAASEPLLKINKITETKKELSIYYYLTYLESFPDGEKISRATTGVALLNKTRPDAMWKLNKIEDMTQTLRFTKGTTLGKKTSSN